MLVLPQPLLIAGCCILHCLLIAANDSWRETIPNAFRRVISSTANNLHLYIYTIHTIIITMITLLIAITNGLVMTILVIALS